MRGMGMQKVSWGWPATALSSACALGAVALYVLVRPEATDLAGTAAAASLIVHVVVLVAAAFIYLHWRLSGNALAGWLTLTLIILSVPQLALSSVLIADPAAADRGPWWPLLTKVMVAGALFVLVLLAGRLDALPASGLPVDPLAAGLASGIGFGALGLALVRWAPELVVPSPVLTALTLVPVLLALGIVMISMRGAELTRGARSRLVLGVALVTLGEAVTHSAHSTAPGRAVNIVASSLGAVLLCHAALEMVRASIRGHRREVASVYARLIAVESSERRNRAQLHEVASTVAGITSVSRLINEPTIVLPRQRRSVLEHALDAELGRLERLMRGDSERRREFAVDDVLRQLVVAQHAQGRTVGWEPTGHTACGSPDDLAEAVHVLLENAARHGGSRGVAIDVGERDGILEIRVSDGGPGIAPDVRGHVFEWGTSGPGSHGQGIGLTIARDLVEQQGGYLLLDDSPRPGTTFVVGVMVGERNDAAGHRAG
jgi:signal transduction histidine kinase